jgi:hypothetical protein
VRVPRRRGAGDYLDACAAIVFPGAAPDPRLLEWSDEQVAAVQQVIAAHSFFSGYGFTDC